MSPDWSAKIEPVPYAKLDNPQSLNLYAYATDAPCNSKKVNVQTEHKAQQQIGPNYTPSGGNETLGVTAGRINNETNGMKDSNKENMPLSGAEKLMAHQRINAERHYGKNVQRRAGMMAPLMSGPGYKRALASTIAAAREDARGVDPTHGAFQYNMRTPAQAAGGRPFEGQSVHTVSGPYVSPSKYTYIVTYGPNQ